MEHGESGGDAAPRTPDGPTPAREQLPLPRRRRQAHLEPQLRTQHSAGTGTPFAAFDAQSPHPPAPAPPPESADRAERTDRIERIDRPDRAAAFHAGTRRGRGTGRTRRAARRPEQGPPQARPTEY
ncbi:hypothetical protein [Pseudonocardia aurantiaca]